MGRSSTKQHQQVLESSSPTKDQQQPHLSGAYIRSLVKQLASNSKSTPSSKIVPKSVGDGSHNDQTRAQSQTTGLNPQPQQHKKQVRRRLHTSRPYQERLLNMAEARREIVTALKFHRASMKQQQQQQQQQQHDHEHEQQQLSQSSLSSLSPPPLPEQQHFVYNNLPASSVSSSSSSWPICPSNPPLVYSNLETSNIILPNQTLGLNLNIHDFNNCDNTLVYNNNYNYDMVGTNYLYGQNNTIGGDQTGGLSHIDHDDFMMNIEQGSIPVAAAAGGDGLYHEMDDEEMAEIRSIGEKHEMEWKDKMNFATSAWWFKFLKSMEVGSGDGGGCNSSSGEDDEGYNSQFDHQVIEFPPWLNNDNEGCCYEQHINDLSTHDYLQDPALPCMDFEEIEGMDGDWLS